MAGNFITHFENRAEAVAKEVEAWGVVPRNLRLSCSGLRLGALPYKQSVLL